MFFGLLCAGGLIGPVAHDFDERALPSVTLQDLDRFHDPLLALQFGAEPWKIARYTSLLEEHWWDTAGFDHEYQQELKRLRWAYECWLCLRDANIAGQLKEDGIYNIDPWRTERLRQLRRLLGPQLYYMGRLPDYPSETINLEPDPDPEFPG